MLRRSVGQLKLRMEAVRDGLACLPRLLGERWEIQAKRLMRAADLARLVVWSPRTVQAVGVTRAPYLATLNDDAVPCGCIRANSRTA